MNIRNMLKQFLKRLTISVTWILGGALFGFGPLFVGWLIFGSVVGAVSFLLGLIILAIGLFLFAYWYLAKPYVNKWFTFAKEGTSKIIVKGDAFWKALIQWDGFTLDEEENVIPEGVPVKDGKVVPEGTEGAKKYYEPWHPLGGFRYYGLYPIMDILLYNLRWHDIQKTLKGEEPVFHDEKDLDYVLLQPDVYWRGEVDVETGYLRRKLEKDAQAAQMQEETEEMERIAVTVEWLITLRVVNPRKALFRAPIGYIENFLLKLSPLLRAFVTARDLDTLLLLKGKGKDIWDSLKETEELQLIEQLRNEWGIQVDENGIQIWRITPPPDIQRAAAEQRKQEMASKGRAAKTAGMVIDMFCAITGLKKNALQREYNQNPQAFIEKHNEAWKKSWDIVQRQMGIEANAYQDLRTSNVFADIATILAGGIPGAKRKEKKEEKEDEQD